MWTLRLFVRLKLNKASRSSSNRSSISLSFIDFIQVYSEQRVVQNLLFYSVDRFQREDRTIHTYLRLNFDRDISFCWSMRSFCSIRWQGWSIVVKEDFHCWFIVGERWRSLPRLRMRAQVNGRTLTDNATRTRIDERRRFARMKKLSKKYS